MATPKLKIKKINNFFQKLPRALGENAFLTFLGLFMIVLILSGVLFYKYNILVKKTELKAAEKQIEFQEKTYQDVLKIWQEREKRFKEAGSKAYPDPFRLTK